jgi:hypothetical protein
MRRAGGQLQPTYFRVASLPPVPLLLVTDGAHTAWSAIRALRVQGERVYKVMTEGVME